MLVAHSDQLSAWKRLLLEMCLQKLTLAELPAGGRGTSQGGVG